MFKKLILTLGVILLFAGMANADGVTALTRTNVAEMWTIQWNDATAATDNQTPVTDTAMNVHGADTITISCSTEAADDIGGTGNGATSVDIDVLGSQDCTNFDDVTLPYVSGFIAAMADAMATTQGLTVGNKCIKLRLDANTAGTADCTCRVTAVWR